MILSTLKDSISELENMEVGEFLTMLFGILIGVAIIAWIIYACVKRKQETAYEAYPICEEQAKVIDCAMLQSNSMCQPSGMKVIFETSRGSRLSFVVPGDATYVVGDQGVLRWQGAIVLSFRRSPTAEAGREKKQPSEAAQQTTLPREETKVTITDGRIVCPKCGLVQGASRRCCFECGVRFDTEV